MKIEIRVRAKNDIDKVGNKYFSQEIEDFIIDAMNMRIEEIKSRYDFASLRGNSEYHRLRVDDYRLGCRYDKASDTLIIMRFLHRSDIYNIFP